MDGSSAPRARRAVFFVSMLAFALTGCANMHPTRTGFLNRYEDLQPKRAFLNYGLGLQQIDVARSASKDELSVIESFYVEPVMWLAPETDWLGRNKHREDRVTRSLDKSLRSRLAKLRPVVDQPGPKTARVRAAVTDVASARPITNFLTSIVWGPISNGGAVVEAEVVAPDGHRIAAIDGSQEGGALDVVGFYTRSGHGKAATRRLAGELVDAVELKNVPSNKPPNAPRDTSVTRAGLTAISDWWNGPP